VDKENRMGIRKAKYFPLLFHNAYIEVGYSCRPTSHHINVIKFRLVFRLLKMLSK
jgi:hypothetical protein